MKILLGALAAVAGTAVSILVLVGATLLFLLAPSRDEVLRVSSPDAERDAVVIETNGGATTSFGYEIYVVPVGGSPRWHRRVAFLYGAIRSHDAYGVNVKWDSPRTLVGEFLEAMSAEVEQPLSMVAGQAVEIRLESGTVDPTALPGGMQYNLAKRRSTKTEHALAADAQNDLRR